MATTASTGSRARPKHSNGWRRKASWPTTEGIARKVLRRNGVWFPSAVKRPGSQSHSAQVQGAQRGARLNVFYAALRDIAHELGLGFVARSSLAFADIPDVADTGRSGILRDHRPDHAVARGKVRRQRRVDRHHLARYRRCGGG